MGMFKLIEGLIIFIKNFKGDLEIFQNLRGAEFSEGGYTILVKIETATRYKMNDRHI